MPKNTEKSLKFVSKMNLNAKGEREVCGVWAWRVEYGDVGHGMRCGIWWRDGVLDMYDDLSPCCDDLLRITPPRRPTL